MQYRYHWLHLATISPLSDTNGNSFVVAETCHTAHANQNTSSTLIMEFFLSGLVTTINCKLLGKLIYFKSFQLFDVAASPRRLSQFFTQKYQHKHRPPLSVLLRMDASKLLNNFLTLLADF
jgi:hypothetical protein